MPPREWRLRIEDILDAASRAMRHVAEVDLEGFMADEKTIDAVARCFDIIGEAVNAVPKDVVAAHPEIPWKVIRGMRNVLAHQYFGVTNETLWRTVREDLPPLVENLKKLLASQ